MPFHREKRPSVEKSKNKSVFPFNPLLHAFGVYLPYYAPHIRKDSQSRVNKKRKGLVSILRFLGFLSSQESLIQRSEIFLEKKALPLAFWLFSSPYLSRMLRSFCHLVTSPGCPRSPGQARE